MNAMETMMQAIVDDTRIKPDGASQKLIQYFAA